ncbi:pyridoxal-phosphate dependent enzyme [Hujiaoplasma nucleasis]|uniref:Pyridoxal-phosphate dependent enzyme n=1 Tax=Hujiaoplasma nucleasis TaxID=2725268 RepID=A0A7L6N2N7_9MOLU|nr:pyridoxal-phosphate dependent enzyme [Hujiaoplasma nucleasis]QLY39488.1 pyridoxal-phosphate dependent enzyme [Hujiaoplasma nucleasis]
MKKIGKTPLLRARNIEKKLGVKRIYLKLEGANSTGSKQDRFVERIVYSAISQNKKIIVAEGSKPYLKSLSFFTDLYHIKLKVIQYKNQKWKNSLGSHVIVIDQSHQTKSSVEKNIDIHMDKTNDFRAIEGLDHKGLAELAYKEIAEEMIDKMKKPATSVFYTHSKDYHDSIYNGYLMDSMKSQNPMPEIYTIEEGNYDKDLITTDLLDQAYRLLSRTEHLKLKKKQAIVLAHFIAKVNQGDISDGEHIIILEQAKTRLQMTRLENFNEISKDEILSYVDHYLDRYSDPLEEASDALDNAIDKGFILIASRDDSIDGVCIVVHTGFDHFIPTYHLAYIGTNPNSKGRGLGTELIEYAVNLSDGNISLHVDLDNYRAKKLYEKMGFKHIYNRMIFQREE